MIEKKKYAKRKYTKKPKEVKVAIEMPEMKKEVEVKKPIEKKKKIIGMRYFIIYIGKATHMSLSGVGKITIGKRYEVRKESADFLDGDKNYTVIREPVFEE